MLIKRLAKVNNDNSGSVMLTVIITFLFISVLLAIILPLTLMNFKMKTIERRAKDEFYYAEKSLNDIYSGVGKECAKELGRVYSNTLANKYEYTDEKLAYETFCESYIAKMVELFYKKDAQRVNLKEKLNKYVTYDSKNRAIVNNAVDETDENTYIKVHFVKKDGTEVDYPNPGDYKEYKKIIIKDIYVSSIDGSEYKSSITTDIAIQIPEISFFKVNENELDYALVGCRGLELHGKTDVVGNVYGGVDKNGDASTNVNYCKGGIDVSKLSDIGEPLNVSFTSNYVVSAADITINNGNFKVLNGHSTNDNEVWVENIIVGKKTTDDRTATLSVDGDTYALNDFQVEGKNKTVTLRGNYYGYGDGKDMLLPTREEMLKPAESGDVYYDDIARSKSSSLIVNAKESEINLSGLKNLVLLGQAYIDHNSKYNLDNNNYSVANPTDAKLSKDETGLAGTMKASQEILLVPEEFIDLSNPTLITSTKTDFVVDTTALKEWANLNFAGTVKLDNSAPTRTVKMQKGSDIYAYCYLQFDNTNEGDKEKYRNAYITSILNCDLNNEPDVNVTPHIAYAPTLQSLKKRVLAAVESQESEMITDGISNVYAKNSGVISFAYGYEMEGPDFKLDAEGNKIKEKGTPYNINSIKIVNNASDNAGYASSSSIGNLAKKYNDLSTFLDFNSDFTKGVISTDYNSADYPFGRLWWKTGIENEASTPIRTDFGDCRVIINGNSTLDLGSYLNSYPMDVTLTDDGYLKLIVVSTGDVIIDENVKMKGFIFSNGKVIVNSDKTLDIISDLSVVQKRISSEVSDVKANMPVAPDATDINSRYTPGYIIRYLLKTDFDASHKLVKQYDKSSIDVIGNRRYNISTKETSDSSMVVNSDYTAFVSFERWKKTGAGGQ